MRAHAASLRLLSCSLLPCVCLPALLLLSGLRHLSAQVVCFVVPRSLSSNWYRCIAFHLHLHTIPTIVLGYCGPDRCLVPEVRTTSHAVHIRGALAAPRHPQTRAGVRIWPTIPCCESTARRLCWRRSCAALGSVCAVSRVYLIGVGGSPPTTRYFTRSRRPKPCPRDLLIQFDGITAFSDFASPLSPVLVLRVVPRDSGEKQCVCVCVYQSAVDPIGSTCMCGKL